MAHMTSDNDNTPLLHVQYGATCIARCNCSHILHMPKGSTIKWLNKKLHIKFRIHNFAFISLAIIIMVITN